MGPSPFGFGVWYCNGEFAWSLAETLRVRLDRGVKKWEDGKYLVFPLVCLVGGVEKWDDGKLFCLVGEKNGMMENIIYIN